MTALILIAMLGSSPPWTGNHAPLGSGVLCEYDRDPEPVWRTIPYETACPARLPRLDAAAQSRAALTAELARLEAARPSAAWFVPAALSIALGASIGFSALLATAGWPNDPGVPTTFAVTGLLLFVFGIVTSAYLRSARHPYDSRIEDIEALLAADDR